MSDRPRIGLDFDDTLMPTREAMIDLLNAEYGTSVPYEQCDVHFVHQWDKAVDFFFQFFERHRPTIHQRPPYSHMLETLTAWSPHVEFHVVSGRLQCWKDPAMEWLEQHGIKVAAFVCTERDGKALAVKQARLALFIEDRADFAEQVAGEGVPVLLLDRHYNQGFSHPLVERVKDWQEIGKVVARRRLVPGLNKESVSKLNGHSGKF